MSTNLGTILVGLGYDLSALEKGSPEAFRLINSQTMGMSAEMKRASREGAESFRLIDEALGIHLSRPLTRIITQEFPAFASALQSVLGVGVVGALGVAGVELFDKMSKKIEEARAAQEHFAEASRNVDVVIGDVLGGISRKIAELTDTEHVLRFKLAGAAEAKQDIDQIAKAIDAAQAAGEKANSFWTKADAAAGDFFSHVAEGWTSIADAFGGDQIAEAFGTKNLHDSLFDTQQFINMKEALADMRTSFDEALNNDKLKGTHEALQLAAKDAQIATEYLSDMTKAGDKAGQTLAGNAEKFYQNSEAVEQGRAKVEGIQIAAEKLKAALEAQHEAIRELQGDLKGWNDEANKGWENWIKINAEIEKAMANLGSLPDSAKRFQEASKVFFPSISQVGPPPGAPQLADQAELFKVTNDQTEAYKKAGEVLQQIETPQEKYAAGLAVLKELNLQGRLSTDQLTAAEHLLSDQLVQAQSKVQGMEDRLQKLLEKTNSASAGMQAFFLQLQKSSGAGMFTFDILNKGLQGFEDETVKALTGAKTNWRSFFESLDQMALKFTLNSIIKQLLSPLNPNQGTADTGGASSSTVTHGGVAAILGGLFGTGGGSGSFGSAAASPQMTALATALAANTTALTTNTTAIISLTTTMQSSSAGGASGAGGSGGDGFLSEILGLFFGGGGGGGGAAAGGDLSGLLDLGITPFASGTDYAPGGLSLVGENGPELMNVPAGASITPNSMLRGHTINLSMPIDAKGAEIGVETKIARAISAAAPQMIMRAVVEAAEVQRRTPR